jgi:hypothetical protein
MESTITIKGEKVPVYFGMMALEQFTKEVGALDAGSVLQIGQMTCLAFAGIKNAAFRNRVISPVSFADVCDAVEEMFYTEEGNKELTDISMAFAESKAVKQLTEEVKKKKVTKKSTGMK